MSELTQSEMDALTKVMENASANAPTSPYMPESTISRTQFAQLNPNFEGANPALKNVKDVSIEVEAVLGKSKVTLEQLLKLQTGQVLPLDTLAGEPVDIVANGKVIAKGEVVVIGPHFGVRITNK